MDLVAFAATLDPNTHDPKGNTMRIKEAVSTNSDESPEDDDIMLGMAIMLDYINNPKRDNLDWLIPSSNLPPPKQSSWA